MTWYAKPTGGYLMGSIEADANATEALNILMVEYGWTKAAACGMFGNIDFEGGWNPWRWENENILTQAAARAATGAYSMRHGYGLIGWTPAKKFQFNNAESDNHVIYFPNYNQESFIGYGPNWSDVPGLATDGAAQIRLIGEAMARGSGNIWLTRKPCTASQFIRLNDPRTAAYYWLYNAEAPEDPQSKERERMNAAAAWYSHLGGILAAPFIVLLKRAIDNQVN